MMREPVLQTKIDRTRKRDGIDPIGFVRFAGYGSEQFGSAELEKAAEYAKRATCSPDGTVYFVCIQKNNKQDLNNVQ